jgi:hypothetical protein
LSTENSGTLPWTMDPDGSCWRAQLPDGRTAVIRRVLGDDGLSSSSFVPTVHESREDYVTGPARAGVLAAAQWAAEYAARPAPCGLCQLRAERGIEPPPGGCTCLAGDAAQDAR